MVRPTMVNSIPTPSQGATLLRNGLQNDFAPTPPNTAVASGQPPSPLKRVPTEKTDFSKFRDNKTMVEVYQNDIVKSVGKIKAHIEQFASGSASTKGKALNKLELYLVNRVKCPRSELQAIVLNEHRENLSAFAKSLDDSQIKPDHKTACALELAMGLGVCAEGEYLNIYEQTTRLYANNQGLEAKVKEIQNAMIEQNLLLLVRSEAGIHMHSRQAEALEIHQVQALKNHLHARWGLTELSDKYVNPLFQKQAGKMAEVLLKETVTPLVIAQELAGALRETLTDKLSKVAPGNSQGGIAAKRLTTEHFTTIEKIVKLEFGEHIALGDCLGISEDGQKINIQSNEALVKIVLGALKNTPLIPDDADLDSIVQAGTKTFADMHPNLVQYRDGEAALALWGSAVLPNTVYHHITGIGLADDREKKHRAVAEAQKSSTPTSPAKHWNENPDAPISTPPKH